ncbi:MAG: putative transporter [Mediterranea sp.]|jgi:putative transport protein|nr:putative transporter [Mediterranea sp.]
MNWINSLLWQDGVAHSILILAFVIAVGIQLGKLKVCGVSLGVTMVLFMGILLSHFGFLVNDEVLHFFKEFGLILFVFSVGLQVGPGFFSSFKQGGITLNMLAAAVVLLGVGTAIVLHFATDVPMSTMVGILSGAVTNTPGLGAAQQAYADSIGVHDDSIALGYAVAYPLGVVGIILTIVFFRYAFRINLQKEAQRLADNENRQPDGATPVSLLVRNPAIFGKSIAGVSALLEHRRFVVSRVWYADGGRIEIATGETVLHENDRIFVIAAEADIETIQTFIGEVVQMDRKQWMPTDSQLAHRRIIITKSAVNGRRLGDLNLRHLYGVNVTRVTRAGGDLVAGPNLILQMGDKLNVVGSEPSLDKIAELMGNSSRHLNDPNLITIFLGIALGVVVGSIPFTFPGIPQPVKLGLAGGPLIVAILIGRFGYRYKLITYTTLSANLMLREVGISVFLACVGLGAGEAFVDTLVNRGGFAWIGYGVLITVVPLLIVGFVARVFFRINYFTLMGLLAGSTTDPPALAYSNAAAGNDAPAVGYATVYPLTMFLRVLAAQLLILLFCA